MAPPLRLAFAGSAAASLGRGSTFLGQRPAAAVAAAAAAPPLPTRAARRAAAWTMNAPPAGSGAPPPPPSVAAVADAVAAASTAPLGSPLPAALRAFDATRPNDVPFVLSSLLAAYFTSAPAEYSATKLEVIAGSLPTGLVGTLLRNGPGKCHVNPDSVAPGEKYILPFDGDGMIHKFVFTPEGDVVYANAFVRTRGYVAETCGWQSRVSGHLRHANRPPARAVPDPVGPSTDGQRRDPTVQGDGQHRTSVARRGQGPRRGRDGAAPWRSRATLRTIGPDSLDGLLATSPGAAVMTTGVAGIDRLVGLGADALCAHPRPAPVVGGGGARRMIAFGVKPVIGGGGGLTPSVFRVSLYEFDVGSWVPVDGHGVGVGPGQASATATPAVAAPVTRQRSPTRRRPPGLPPRRVDCRRDGRLYARARRARH
eukprot:TRINITY_DN6641_c0_g1_i1.p1 TRINITY_DN6641_c0_g1~~TRINITY_DN6641_c0_g1_i1.p1  ORF type:complete len:476 (+),score=83.22 TRINITY_DN6641_c0_g1_i1:152-1429(+)